MDAFFASVEQRDNPAWQGKPLVVGSKGRRGVVSAASYEARKFGVRSAMPSFMALRKCPHLIFAPLRFEVYKYVSMQIRDIFYDYTDLVEPLSLDEAFLDVTKNKVGIPSASIIAKDIKRRIKIRTGLTASAGVSINKFLAKVASDYDKPNGFFLIKPEEAEEFTEKLPVEKFFGVGKVTVKKMHEYGIFTGNDLKKIKKEQLIAIFGNRADYYYSISRAVDFRKVISHRQRKSIGAERTFEYDLQNKDEIIGKLNEITEILYSRCLKINTFGKTLTVKIKFADFKQITRSKTNKNYIKKQEEIKKQSYSLIEGIDFISKGIRLLGLSVSNLDNDKKEKKKEVWKQLKIPFLT